MQASRQPEPRAFIGAKLVAGDFNNDGYDELMVGAPDMDWNGIRDAGAVIMYWGSTAGLRSASGCGCDLLVQSATLVGGAIEAYDHLVRRFWSRMSILMALMTW